MADLAPPLKADRVRLLRECRDLARARLNQAFTDSFPKVEKDILRRLEAAVTSAESDVYFQTMAHLKTNRVRLLQEFATAFGALFEEQLERKGAPKAADNDSSGELSLVDVEQMDWKLDMEKLVRKIGEAVNADQANALRIRMAFLFERDALNDHDNPFSANTVVEALQIACDKMQAMSTVQRALLYTMQPYIAAGIEAVYVEANQVLIAKGVLPKIKLAYSKGQGAPATAAGMDGAEEPGDGGAVMGGAVMGGAIGRGMPDMPSDVNNIEAAISRQISSRSHGGMERLMSAVEMVARQNMSVDEALQSALPMGKVVPGVMFSSSSMVPKAVRLEAARALSDPKTIATVQQAAPQLLDTLSSLQNSFEPAYAHAGLDGQPVVLQRADILAQLGEQAQHATIVDQVTIDLVGEMFETIIANPTVDEVVKTQLLRLQIVTVKSALLDRTFFANEEHPVRRFIELIVKAGSDPEIDFLPQGPFMVVLRGIVGEIIETFRDDFGIFASAYDQLQSLLEEAHRDHSQDVAASEEELLRKEKLENAKERAHAEVMARMEPDAPLFVREFLVDWWEQALVESDLKGRVGDTDSWEARAQLVTNLMWSLHTRSGTEIETLAKVVAGVVKGLLAGMLAIQMPREERVAFSNQLLQIHTHIIRAAKEAAKRAAGTPAPVPASAARMKTTSPPPASHVVVGSTPSPTLGVSPGLNIDTVQPPAPLPPVIQRPSPPKPPVVPVAVPTPKPREASEDPHESTALQLKNGDVVQLKKLGVRARLMWVSPSRNNYLFLSPGQKHTFSHTAVVGMLKDGSLEVAARETKGVVKSMFDHLEEGAPTA